MKSYFAKYLPVEGEIKPGDLFECLDETFGHKPYEMPFEKEKQSTPCSKCRKVKLFLCSRDIQVGDEVHYNYNHDIKWIVDKLFTTTLKSGSGEHPINTVYKVIGEISPDAKVKEGDEFDEDQIKITLKRRRLCICQPEHPYFPWKNPDCPHLKEDHRGGELCMNEELYNFVEIKCPWGHFH